jgi:hypothetical protein
MPAIDTSNIMKVRTKMTLRTLAATAGAVALGALLIAGSLFAGGTREPDQSIPRGFCGGQYLILETTNHAVTVLERPHLRTLGDRTYVVGSTVSLPGVTDDELFGPTTQWVCLEDVRRMGEASNKSTLDQIRVLAEKRRVREEELARSRQ